MGSITPLLDTLLHQVLGRQLSLDAYARQPVGPSAVSAVIRDGAVDDATQSSDDSASNSGSSSEESDFADSISTAQSRQQEGEASSVTTASSVRRAAALSESLASLSDVPSAASAQLVLSDAARVLSEQARLIAQQTLLSNISDDILAESTSAEGSASLGASASVKGEQSTALHSQPTILLPLAEQSLQEVPHDRAVSLYQHDDLVSWAPALSSSGSASLDVSRAARELNQWTAVLSQQDWQALLSSEVATSMPLRFLSTALIMETLAQGVSLEAQRDAISGYLASALKTSGLFHEALLVQWANGNLPQEIIEQSARQRQQLLSVLPASPELGDAVIRQQLQLMAGQSIHFQSELWAGAMMLMSFRTEPYLSPTRRDGSAERHFPAFPEQRRVWTLTLTFELPNLGTVTAGIQWDGEHLSVTLGAEHDATRMMLAEYREQLEQLLNTGHDLGRAVEINEKSGHETAMNISSTQGDAHV